MANTGWKHFNTRTLFFTDGPGGLLIDSGIVEDNVFDDNYIYDIEDYVTCPIPTYRSDLDRVGAVACFASIGSPTIYFCNTNPPAIGSIYYTESNGSEKLDGLDDWWKVVAVPTLRVKINSDGEVIDIEVCII